MSELTQFKVIRAMAKLMLVVFLMVYGDVVLFMIASQLIFWIMVLRAIRIRSRKRFRFYLIFLYVLLSFSQIFFFARYLSGTTSHLWLRLVMNASGIFVLSMPYLLEYLVTVKKYTAFYLPTVQDLETMSFGQIRQLDQKVRGTLADVSHLRRSVTPERVMEIAEDLPRHSSVQYLNEGSLTPAYFEEALRSLEDPHLYIVISSTGSAASEILSVFTRKQYNHASLSFDRDLETIISYNGGEKVYPPGLNQEMIEFFNKKEDASLIVYELDASKEQKTALIDKVQEINRDGSAYNMLGLVLKTSLKPNIMFCSQFVYNMLKTVGLEYFDKPGGMVKPTDLVELDYHRKLKFCYELHLNDQNLISSSGNDQSEK